MVSDSDRDHFRRIAEAEARFNRAAVRACAARTPGANIALGFALSAFATAFGADLSRPDEASPARRWRERTIHRASDP